jgi:hypothetical protein
LQWIPEVGKYVVAAVRKLKAELTGQIDVAGPDLL